VFFGIRSYRETFATSFPIGLAATAVSAAILRKR
jgi:hypothetical protein